MFPLVSVGSSPKRVCIKKKKFSKIFRAGNLFVHSLRNKGIFPWRTWHVCPLHTAHWFRRAPCNASFPNGGAGRGRNLVARCPSSGTPYDQLIFSRPFQLKRDCLKQTTPVFPQKAAALALTWGPVQSWVKWQVRQEQSLGDLEPMAGICQCPIVHTAEGNCVGIGLSSN